VRRRDFLRASAAALSGAVRVQGGPPIRLPPAAAEPGRSLRRLAEQRGLLVGTAFSNGAYGRDPAYGDVAAREFNLLVGENNMKLDVLQHERGRYDFSQPDAMMDFAAAHGMKVRAVPLVWHEALPAWLKDRTPTRAEALAILREHISAVVGRYRGRIFAWDVVNEALDETKPGLREDGPWFRSIGPEYVELAYRWAHEADPGAALFYNDYGMDGPSAKADRCHAWIKSLLARGVPIHGIGLQYHVQVDKHPVPAETAGNIRRFNDLGLAVHITELDVWVPKDAPPSELLKQAEVYRGVFETALAAPDCKAVALWGFTDRYSWVPSISNGTYGRALIYDPEYHPKPAYEAIAAALRDGPRSAS
jgi:endo-1,4-beta-xylanase